ncbi:MAG TPA: hypothetical protein VFG20_09410 [Planctomycetaceae bacterium]|nr:hypothetical protein [Planctomycetaceae bacterium]
MRSSAHSSLATVLLLIPILAVPMLAIFGVPQFTPVVASPFDEAKSRKKNDTEAPPFSPASRDTDSFDQFASNATEDVPAWATDTTDHASQKLADRRSRPRIQPVSREIAQAEPTAPSPFNSDMPAVGGGGTNAIPGSYRRPRQDLPTVDPSPSKPTPRTIPVVAEPQLTWNAAVQRLNGMGIRSFRLEPGNQPTQFLFYCSYTPRDNPRVSYRFEAEADDPLRAVERVLEQIDTWLAAR